MASNVNKRLPRKRKKRLKKFGGWEYYIQVPSKKKLNGVTEQDFIDVITELDKKDNFTLPEYYGNGMVKIVSNEFVGFINAESFHEAMKKEAKRQCIYGK